MAIYAVGDLQGCFAPFRELLHLIAFDPASDQLWLTGDLVNRGPDSLATLRFVKNMGDAVTAVLGNHDLHLLGVAAGARPTKESDTFAEILQAPDRDELLSWLRHRPLAHLDESLRTMMTHAGVYIRWGPEQVMGYARELETILQSGAADEFLHNIFSKTTVAWTPALTGRDRYRFLADAFSRMRFLTKDGRLELQYKGPPGSQPDSLLPWFRHPERQCRNWRIVFGHWSALGFLNEANLIGLDSGCLWGRQLTAVRLDNAGGVWQVPCS